jgi:hypothetical protein
MYVTFAGSMQSIVQDFDFLKVNVVDDESAMKASTQNALLEEQVREVNFSTIGVPLKLSHYTVGYVQID